MNIFCIFFVCLQKCSGLDIGHLSMEEERNDNDSQNPCHDEYHHNIAQLEALILSRIRIAEQKARSQSNSI